MKRLWIITLILIVCAGNRPYAQQMPLYSQYILNEFLINPSVAGVDGLTTINFTGRKQWIGFDNSPNTYSATISSRILKKGFIIKRGAFGSDYRKSTKGRVGIGAGMIVDKSGAINRTGMHFTYAYHIFIQNSQLSFGLAATAFQFKIDEEIAQLKYPDNDPINSVIGKSAYIPDARFGIHFMTQEFSIGLSVNNILESPVKFGEVNLASDQLEQAREYFLTWTYRTRFQEKPAWEFEPSFIIRTNDNFHLHGDITGRLIYKREYWAGLSFRTSKDFIFLLGIKYDRFLLGYSFDYGLNPVSRLSYGSHEITLAVKLGDSVRRYRWLERY